MYHNSITKCKKYPYRTRLDAALETLTRPVTLYTYRCPNCLKYHLTRQKQVEFVKKELQETILVEA